MLCNNCWIFTDETKGSPEGATVVEHSLVEMQGNLYASEDERCPDQ